MIVGAEKFSILKYIILISSVMFMWFIILSINYPTNINQILQGSSLSVYSSFSRNDPVVINITEFCNFDMSTSEQVDCVVSQVNIFFNYTHDNRDKYIIKSPSMVYATGGVCRDYAVMYDSIFTNLGYDTTFVFPEHHVYNVMWKTNETDSIYCSVDQDRGWCI